MGPKLELFSFMKVSNYSPGVAWVQLDFTQVCHATHELSANWSKQPLTHPHGSSGEIGIKPSVTF